MQGAGIFGTKIFPAVFSIPGVCLLAALDSAPFFALPFGIDAAVIILAAQRPGAFWLVGAIAAVASIPGAALTFYVGQRVGEVGLRHLIPERRLRSIEHRLRTRGAVALALLDLVPPPFPFKACILVAGGLRTNRTTFFATLLAGRLMRFGGEGALAAAYGPQILGWIESETLAIGASLLVVFGLIAGAFSVYQKIRALHRRSL